MDTVDGLLDFHLDILGQKPRINRLYTQITFCFELPDSVSRSDIVHRLSQGVERLSASFPWVAGTVVKEDDTFKIRPSQNGVPSTVKDLTDETSFPTWDTLLQANFPFSMLDETFVAPRKTLAVSDASASQLPVFLSQVNFITGGLLLTFNGQHGSMDMAGQCQIIFLLAKACRNKSFTTLELSIGNMDRKTIIPLLSAKGSKQELDQKTAIEKREERHQSTQAKAIPLGLTWAYFIFSSTSLASLKSLAMTTVAPGSFVSTDDVLSAFVWQSISRARLPRLDISSQLGTTLSRNVDMRRYMLVTSTYPGVVTGSTEHAFSIDELVQEPLGKIAAQLRSALDGEALVHKLRVQATHISDRDNKPMPSFAVSSTPELDVRLSSWAKEKCYEFDFGFGKPKAVRRPRFEDGAREGLVYFLPKTLDGEIAAGLCLRDEDLERLKHDEEFRTHGTYVG